MGSPVCGLRPVRGARSLTANVPKPTRITGSDCFSDSVTASSAAASARVADAFEISADSAILSINSALFTLLAPQGMAMLLCGISSERGDLYPLAKKGVKETAAWSRDHEFRAVNGALSAC